MKPLASPTTIGVRLLGRAVEFSHPPAPGSVTASVPVAKAMKLLVSDNAAFAPSGKFPRQIILGQSTTVREQIDLLPKLYVRPSGGRAFVVSPVRGDTRPSVYLMSVSTEDAELVDYLHASLGNEFDVLRGGREGRTRRQPSRSHSTTCWSP